jgi:3-oxoacyl-[acyl-carrier protein] reductase
MTYSDSNYVVYPELNNKVVMITGALGGLGSSFVEAFSTSNSKIVLHHIGQTESAEKRKLELNERGVEALIVEAELTNSEAISAIFEETERRIGPVDVLINNAGYMKGKSFLKMTLEEWKRTIDIDLTSVFLTSQLAARQMSRVGSGVIINISSQLAYKGAPEYADYCAAKAGIVGLTHAAARELGPNIRVNAIAPGPIATAMTSPYLTPEWTESRTRDSVTKRLGSASEVASVAIFLASNGASLFHGQTVHPNGGGYMS